MKIIIIFDENGNGYDADIHENTYRYEFQNDNF